MDTYSYSHLSDHAMLRELATTVSHHRTGTARMLAQIAEVDARKLYLPAGYSSMYLYCVHELRMSEDVAYKRICAARAARRFPLILPAVAEGRLHLSAVVLLAPHLTLETAEELLTSATHMTRAAVELLLAQRFPKPDVPTLIQGISPAIPSEEKGLTRDTAPDVQLAPGRVVPSFAPSSHLPVGPVPAPLPVRAKPVPLSSGRFALQVTVDQATHDQLLYAQALLGHTAPRADVGEVLKRALDALVAVLEKQKFARSARSIPRRATAKGRHIPAVVRRTVWERDGGRCTFVSERGKRCESLTRLEFDHVEPVARGGMSTVNGLRLRCRAHNQYAAECTFGAEFMRGKRVRAR
jgi:5-methylcytosine-specific restriction endonuclease McrA